MGHNKLDFCISFHNMSDKYLSNQKNTDRHAKHTLSQHWISNVHFEAWFEQYKYPEVDAEAQPSDAPPILGFLSRKYSGND